MLHTHISSCMLPVAMHCQRVALGSSRRPPPTNSQRGRGVRERLLPYPSAQLPTSALDSWHQRALHCWAVRPLMLLLMQLQEEPAGREGGDSAQFEGQFEV